MGVVLVGDGTDGAILVTATETVEDIDLSVWTSGGFVQRHGTIYDGRLVDSRRVIPAGRLLTGV